MCIFSSIGPFYCLLPYFSELFCFSSLNPIWGGVWGLVKQVTQGNEAIHMSLVNKVNLVNQVSQAKEGNQVKQMNQVNRVNHLFGKSILFLQLCPIIFEGRLLTYAPPPSPHQIGLKAFIRWSHYPRSQLHTDVKVISPIFVCPPSFGRATTWNRVQSFGRDGNPTPRIPYSYYNSYVTKNIKWQYLRNQAW